MKELQEKARAAAIADPCLVAEENCRPRFKHIEGDWYYILALNLGLDNAEEMGGPTWHASVSFGLFGVKSLREIRERAVAFLEGFGDATLGESRDGNFLQGVVHIRRRMSEAEMQELGIEAPRDIRGTKEEKQRLQTVRQEVGENTWQAIEIAKAVAAARQSEADSEEELEQK